MVSIHFYVYPLVEMPNIYQSTPNILQLNNAYIHNFFATKHNDDDDEKGGKEDIGTHKTTWL